MVVSLALGCHGYFHARGNVRGSRVEGGDVVQHGGGGLVFAGLNIRCQGQHELTAHRWPMCCCSAVAVALAAVARPEGSG